MAHYDMEDQNGSALTDVSGNARNANFGGSGSAYVTSDVGEGSVSFLRNGGWQNIPAVTPATGILSLAMWYREPNTVRSNSEIIWGATSTRTPWIYVSNAAGNIDKLVVEYADQTPQYLTSANNVMMGDTWQHIAVILDSNADTVKAYVDGQLVIDSGNTGVTAAMQGHLGITPGGSVSNVALFDDVRFYDGALSASEIQVLAGMVPEPASGVLLLISGFLLSRFKQRR